MFEYIKGKITVLSPTYCVIENNHIGYLVNISLNTYSKLSKNQETQLYIHQVIREDSNDLFGFYTKDERQLFRLLLTVSGVGANTARVILSSSSSQELKTAIITNNVELLKSVKGIGEKTAKRIILDLKDKIDKENLTAETPVSLDNTTRKEALSALIILGFSKTAVEKVLNQILNQNPQLTVEELIKAALKKL